jgi:hypothetical protein
MKNKKDILIALSILKDLLYMKKMEEFDRERLERAIELLEETLE